MITFKYKQETSGVWRPVADVILETQHNKLEASLYIDSGADISMIPRSTGLFLGFSEKDSGSQIREMKGISGISVPYIKKDIVMRLGDQVKLNVAIAWALTEEVPPLLGRECIFDKFKIIFDEKRKVIEFLKY